MRELPVTSRVAVVTGGGSGIGAEVAKQLAQSGFAVALVGRTREKLDAVSQHIEDAGGSAAVFVADVRVPEDVAALPTVVRDRLGRVDAVVNNAAVLRVEAFERISHATFHDHVATNLGGPLFVTQAFLEHLRRSSDASVVNISSVAASTPRAGSALYGSTKAALEYLTRCLAAELAPDGVRVNALAVGPIDTEIHDSWLPPSGPERDLLLASVPLGRRGTAEEIAWWVSTLCHRNARWMTGAVIPVDGGKALGDAKSYVGSETQHGTSKQAQEGRSRYD